MSNKSENRITIQDVADAANVSLTTVSLVLGNKGNIPQETRDRVKAAVVATGYKRRERRNKSALAPGDGLSILMVDDISNPYFHALYRSISHSLAAKGSLLTLVSSEDSVDQQQTLLRKLADSGINSIFLVPATGTSAKNLAHTWLKSISLILVVRNIETASLNFVGSNPMLGAKLATQHLISLGHQDIGFIGGYPANFAYGERYAGIAATLVQHGTTLQPKWTLGGGSTRAFGKVAALKILEQPDHPKALIAYNDIVALGIMDAILEKGLTPGKDIALVGHDNIPEAADYPVALTTVSAPADKLGKVASTAMLNLIENGPGHEAINITNPPKLVVRQSCGTS